jgi:hypothetical protein
MSSMVVAPLGAEHTPERGTGHLAQGGAPAGQVGAVPRSRTETGSDALGSRSRGWRAVRPRTAAVVARAGRRVAAASHDAGMATAEYAIATLAAVGFAGLLVVLLKSDLVRGLLTAIIRKALQG